MPGRSGVATLDTLITRTGNSNGREKPAEKGRYRVQVPNDQLRIVGLSETTKLWHFTEEFKCLYSNGLREFVVPRFQMFSHGRPISHVFSLTGSGRTHTLARRCRCHAHRTYFFIGPRES